MTNSQTYDLVADITHALEGWITNGANVTAFDRLNTLKINILEGRYGDGVTLDTLKATLEARGVEFGKCEVGDEEWRRRWQLRTESLADNVGETISFLKERH